MKNIILLLLLISSIGSIQAADLIVETGIVSKSAISETSVKIDTVGNLTIIDTNGGDSNDRLTLTINGKNLRITDPVQNFRVSGTGVSLINSNTVDVSLSSFTGDLIINTKSGTDVLNLDANLSLTGDQNIQVHGITTLNQNARISYVNGNIDYHGKREINFNVSSELNGSGSGDVIMSSEGHINIEGKIQNVDAAKKGHIVILGGAKGEVHISGTLDSSGKNDGEKGGQVIVLGEKVGLFVQAKIDVSGDAGGGEVLLGGEQQGAIAIKGEANTDVLYIDDGAEINADAITDGNGGRIITWANHTNRAFGDISAQGGALSGDGGFVEISGGYYFEIGQIPDINAFNGEGGHWLIDPTGNDLSIVAGGGNTNINAANPFATTSDAASLGWNLIRAALIAGTTVTVTTTNSGFNSENGNIYVDTDLDYNGIGTGKSLTLNAIGDIIFNNKIFDSSGADDILNLDLASGGKITLDSDGSVVSGTFVASTFDGVGGVFEVEAGTTFTVKGFDSTIDSSITAFDFNIAGSLNYDDSDTLNLMQRSSSPRFGIGTTNCQNTFCETHIENAELNRIVVPNGALNFFANSKLYVKGVAAANTNQINSVNLTGVGGDIEFEAGTGSSFNQLNIASTNDVDIKSNLTTQGVLSPGAGNLFMQGQNFSSSNNTNTESGNNSLRGGSYGHDITFSGAINDVTDGTALSLNVGVADVANSGTIGSTTNVLGALTINANDINIDGNVEASTITLAAVDGSDADSIDISGATLDANGGNITIATDDFITGGTATLMSTGAISATVTLSGETDAARIEVGDSTNAVAGALRLSEVELQGIDSSFSELIIGFANTQSGIIQVNESGGLQGLNTNLHLRSNIFLFSDLVDIDSDIDMSATPGAGLHLEGWSNLAGNITTAGGAVTVNSALTIADSANISIDTTNGGISAAGADIDLQFSVLEVGGGNVEALNLNAGNSGAVSFGNQVGSGGLDLTLENGTANFMYNFNLNSLTLNGGSLAAGDFIMGRQLATKTMNLNAGTVDVGANVLQVNGQSILSGGTLVLDAGGGTAQLNGDVIGTGGVINHSAGILDIGNVGGNDTTVDFSGIDYNVSPGTTIQLGVLNATQTLITGATTQFANVEVDNSSAVGSVVHSGSPLDINGILTVTNGSLETSGGTANVIGAVTVRGVLDVSATGIDIDNTLTLNGTANNALTMGDQLVNVFGSFDTSAHSGNAISVGVGTLRVGGSVNMGIATYTTGTLEMMGNGSLSGADILGNVVIGTPSAANTVNMASNITASSLTLLDNATLDQGGRTLTIQNNTSLNIGSTLRGQNTFTALGGLNINEGSLVNSGSSYSVNATGDVVLDGATLDTGTGTLSLTANDGTLSTGTSALSLIGINVNLATTEDANNTTPDDHNIQIGSGGISGANTNLTITSTDEFVFDGPLNVASLTVNNTLKFEINGLSSFNQLDVGGTLHLNPSELEATLGYTPTIGDRFKIINHNGISGTFNRIHLPKSHIWDIEYNANDITIEVLRSTIPLGQTLNGETTLTCPQDNTLTLEDSEVGFDYYLRNEADDSIVDGPVAGTGNALSFQTGIISEMTSYHVFAANPSYALDFDGTDDYVEIQHNPSIIFSDAVTIEAWVNPTDLTTNTYYDIYRKENNADALGIEGRMLLMFQDNGTHLTLGVETTVNGYIELDVDIDPADYENQWSHILAFYDDATNVMRLYLNGMEIGSLGADGSLVNPTAIKASNAIIGAFEHPTSGIIEHFNGKIASLRVWDKALTTQAEIDQAKNNFMMGDETNLVAYYPFFENIGNQLTDVTSNTNHGIINGASWHTGTSGGFGKVVSNIHTISISPAMDDVYVDINANGNNNGTSWADAYTTVTQATKFINNKCLSNENDVIHIAKGTYIEGTEIVINDPITIKGGYPTGGGEQDLANNQTILDGNHINRVVNASHNLGTLYLEGLIIQNGNLNETANVFGPGIYSIGNIDLQHSVVNHNTATSNGSFFSSGGGVYSDSGSINLSNSIISNNSLVTSGVSGGSGYAYGGGVFTNAGSITLSNSHVCNNSIESYNNSETIFSSESSTSYGGGIYTSIGTINITNSIICNNTAYASNRNFEIANTNANGGGIFTDNGSVILINSQVNNNSTNSSAQFGSIMSNTSWGGGIYTTSGSITIINSQVNNNTCVNDRKNSEGGGIFRSLNSGEITLINSTVIGNSISSIAPGFVNGGGIYGQTNLQNSILWGNTKSSDSGNTFLPSEHDQFSLTTLNSLIKGSDLSATNGIDASDVNYDPLFVEEVSGNYRLLTGSSLIDTGDNSLLPMDDYDVDGDGDFLEVHPLDLDGLTRISGTKVDIGAFEFQQIYYLGGMVSGLFSGNSLTLQNSNADVLELDENGAFSFGLPLDIGEGYGVSVSSQPINPIQPCSVTNGSGTIVNQDIIDVLVSCEAGNDLIFRNGFEITL